MKTGLIGKAPTKQPKKRLNYKKVNKLREQIEENKKKQEARKKKFSGKRNVKDD